MGARRIGAILLLAGVAACGQTLTAVSIKPNPAGPSAAGGVTTDTGRLRMENVSLRELLLRSFALNDYQLVAPDWLSTACFDVQAVADGPVPESAVLHLLQPVVIERFQLKFHRETRPVPVYRLVVARGGSRLQPAADATGNYVGPGTGTIRLDGDFTMQELSADLSGPLQRPVVDATGLAGRFHFSIEFADPRLAGAASSTPAPSLFTALDKQLGLKLVSGKGPIPVLVVDHILHQPSPN